MNKLFVVSYDKHRNTYIAALHHLNNMPKQELNNRERFTQMTVIFGQMSSENPNAGKPVQQI